MDVSIGNVIIIIGLIIACGIMIWQFITANQSPAESDESKWHHDMDNTEEHLEETEEFMRRMERLSKRSIKKDDDDKKK